MQTRTITRTPYPGQLGFPGWPIVGLDATSKRTFRSRLVKPAKSSPGPLPAAIPSRAGTQRTKGLVLVVRWNENEKGEGGVPLTGQS
jgi:hypothetical protein